MYKYTDEIVMMCLDVIDSYCEERDCIDCMFKKYIDGLSHCKLVPLWQIYIEQQVEKQRNEKRNKKTEK